VVKISINQAIDCFYQSSNRIVIIVRSGEFQMSS